MPTWEVVGEQIPGVKMFLMELDFKLTEKLHETRICKIRRD